MIYCFSVGLQTTAPPALAACGLVGLVGRVAGVGRVMTMRLYLVQHGDALAKDADPERGLSTRGREDIGGLAVLLANAGMRVARILHSGKSRARQSAEILAERIGTAGCLETAEGLAPLDASAAWAVRAESAADDLMLVGHQPFMGRLASRLLTGREEPPPVAFVQGAAVCLERSTESGWTLVWMLRPELY